MPSCLVPGCTSGKTNNFGKFHFFTVPKDDVLKNNWQIALKRSKTLFSKTQMVCEKHFHSKDIIRYRHVLDPEGNVHYGSLYRRPRLRPGTVPSLFPWTVMRAATDENSNTSESIPNSSQVLINHTLPQVSESPETSNMLEEMEMSECIGTSNTPAVIKVRPLSELCSSTERQETVTNPIQNYNSCNILENFNFSTLLLCDVDLPAFWRHNNITYFGKSLISFAFIRCEMVDGNYYSFNLKEVIVDSTLKLYTNIDGKPLVDSSYMKNSITSIQELEEYIRKINGLNVCKGTDICDLQEYEKSTSLYSDKRNIIRHKKCTLLCYSNRCNACRIVKDTSSRKQNFTRSTWSTAEASKNIANIKEKVIQAINMGSEDVLNDNLYLNVIHDHRYSESSTLNYILQLKP